MKITIKTLQHKLITLDAAPTETVGDLKAKIHSLHDHPPEIQKLIYAGKVLVDEKTIEEYKIKEKDFLVLMLTKPKPQPAAEVASTSTSESTPAVATTSTSETAQPAPAPAAQPVAAETAPAAQTEAGSPTASGSQMGLSFVSGDALQTSIQGMVEMGFERAQVMRALKAAYNNPDRAVEYLMTGIPEHLANEPAAPAEAPAAPTTTAAAPAPAAPAAAPAVPPAAAAAPAPAAPQNLFQVAQQQQQQQQHQQQQRGGAGGAASAFDLQALRNNPQFEQIRQMVQQNPQLLQPVLQQLANHDPALVQQLSNNPEMLIQLLAEGADAGEGGEGAPPPGTRVINITPEERAAIERLEGLGFDRQAVIEAYFACDKNEELAANFLFEGGFGDEEGAN